MDGMVIALDAVSLPTDAGMQATRHGAGGDVGAEYRVDSPEQLDLDWLLSLEELGLDLLHRTEASFTVVHPCELENPGLYVGPGSVILLTGLAFREQPDKLADYVASAAAAGIVAIGLGIGVYFDTTPEVMIHAAQDHGIALFTVPLPVPFVSILAAVQSELAQRRQHGREQLLEVHEKLNLAARRGVDALLAATAEAIGGYCALVDSDGRVRASHATSSTVALNVTDVEELVSKRGAGVATRLGDNDVLLHPLQHGGDAVSVLVSARQGHFDAAARMILRHASGLVELLLQRPASLRASRQEINALAMAAQLGWEQGRHSISYVMKEVADASGDVRPVVLYSESKRMHEKSLLAFDRVMAMSARYVYALRLDDVSSLILFRGTRSVAHIKETMRVAQGHGRLAIGARCPWVDLDNAVVNELKRLAAGTRPGGVSAAKDQSLLWAKDDAVREILADRKRITWDRLRAADQTNGTELVTSLEVFLTLGGHLTNVSQALQVHRQTVTKRIGQIEELLDVDLNDPLTRADLLVTAQLD